MSDLSAPVSFAHQLGQLEGRITALERKVDVFEERIEGRLATIEGKLDHLTSLLDLGRGGWRVLAMLAALLASALAAAAWVYDHAR